MIEPILMITFLNCFFMLSTTVSTCALWWQNKHYRCRHCGQRHSKVKNAKSIVNKKLKDSKSDVEIENYVECSNTTNVGYEANQDPAASN